MNALFILSGMAALLTGLLSFTRGYRLARLLRAVEPCTPRETGDLPPVSVLAPCRGVDNHFESFARALLTQDYPRYEVVFLVESMTDPAWNVLSPIVAAMPESWASLTVTGPAESCSQKIHNLLIGLDHVDPQTTVLAFVDSDVQVHGTWLKELVAPLREPAIGATSGFRWYEPLTGSLSSNLHSAWPSTTTFNDGNYTQGARWPMPCTAGETAVVIDYNGDVRICELRDYDGDFGRLWNSQAHSAEVAQMRQDHCDCTHICFIDDSATYSPKVALLQSPLMYAWRQRSHEQHST